MTAWKREDFGLSATINGREYWIEKYGTLYNVYCDGKQIPNSTTDALAEAKLAAEAHAVDTPTPAKQGVHIDNIAGQQLIDILKRSFTTAQIQDFIDASPFDEPDTGAPEGGPMG